MKKHLFLLCMFLSAFCLKAQVIGISIETDSPSQSFKTGSDVLSYMHQKYKDGPCKAYTFSQKNKHYVNDTVKGTSEWFESIEFPDKFRIDFGDTTSGNFVIFKNDSSYNYKQFLLTKRNYNANTLLLLLGGMYYRNPEEVNQRLKKENYELGTLSTQKWRKQPVYVIGAQSGDTLSNQIWVSKKSWRVVRIIEKMKNGHMMDMTFDEHQKHCNGYVETKVTFRDNGKIEQQEEYYNIRKVEKFPAQVFSPTQIQK